MQLVNSTTLQRPLRPFRARRSADCRSPARMRSRGFCLHGRHPAMRRCHLRLTACRLSECLNRSCQKILDLERGMVIVRSGKGDKDTSDSFIRSDYASTSCQHHLPSRAGTRSISTGNIQLPGGFSPKALELQVTNRSARSGPGSAVFPARGLRTDPRNGDGPPALQHPTCFSAPFARRSRRRHFQGLSPSMPCGTPSPPTCWRRAPTSAPSRICSVIPICAPP